MEKHIELIEDAKKFWSKFAEENGWAERSKQVTVWINNDGEVIDSVYNPVGSTESYVVSEETDEIIFTH
jgi:hypothetical protein